LLENKFEQENKLKMYEKKKYILKKKRKKEEKTNKYAHRTQTIDVGGRGCRLATASVVAPQVPTCSVE
jgi:hypothetical protein